MGSYSQGFTSSPQKEVSRLFRKELRLIFPEYTVRSEFSWWDLEFKVSGKKFVDKHLHFSLPKNTQTPYVFSLQSLHIQCRPSSQGDTPQSIQFISKSKLNISHRSLRLSSGVPFINQTSKNIKPLQDLINPSTPFGRWCMPVCGGEMNDFHRCVFEHALVSTPRFVVQIESLSVSLCCFLSTCCHSCILICVFFVLDFFCVILCFIYQYYFSSCKT